MDTGKGKGSLRVISKSITFEETSSNIGIGGSFVPNVKLAIINNSNSWKNTIFKNSQNSDYISIGLYDFNSNNNNYIAAIDKSIDLFKDLYINNLGISSQPSSLIGNVIINGKTTIGNSSNDIITNNYLLDINSKTSNNLLILRNSNSFLDFSISNSNFNINTSTNSININSAIFIQSSIISSNPTMFIKGNSILDGSIILGSSNSNPLNPIMFVKGNSILDGSIILGSSNSNPLNPIMFIKGNSILDGSIILGSSNSNPLNPTMFVTGNSILDGSIILGSSNSNPLNPTMFVTGNSILDGSIILGSSNSNPLNPTLFVKGNSIIDGSIILGSSNSNPLNPTMFVTGNSILDGSIILGSSNSNPLNPIMFVKGNSIIDGSIILGSSNSNPLNPTMFVKGNSIIDGSIILGSSNSHSNLNYINSNNYYSFLTDSNLYINCNLDVNGLIKGNIKTSSIILDENKKINVNLINIDYSNAPLSSNQSNQLSFNIDYSNSPLFLNSNKELSFNIDYSNSPLFLNSNKELSFNINQEIFFITSNNELSILGDINLGGGSGESFWRSADLENDPPQMIYFNSGKSYVSINNDDPRSYLYVGPNGNLLRLATISDINDSYYSQIATNDNVDNSNNTKIKLIAPVQQQLLLDTTDISGSIYYNTTGLNPIQLFNYQNNGLFTHQMLINKNGSIFINPFLNTTYYNYNSNTSNLIDNITTNNNFYYNYNKEKLIINGSVLIDSYDSNLISYINIKGKTIIGTSNIEASQFSLYINENNVKINSNLTIGSNLIINNNLIVNGSIIGTGSNISNLKISELYLDDSNLKLNPNFINIDSNTGININDSNQLIIKLDFSKFQMTSNNEISLTSAAVGSVWNSAIPLIIDPSAMTRIYFNKNESFVGINNDDPRSYLYVGPNGNLLRLATITDINESYYSQIATNDNINNSNNTKIKLIAPVQQQLLLDTIDISGSIYYNTTGLNPIQSFNYESNGILTNQLLINKYGTVFINPQSNNNYYDYNSNNEKLIINGSTIIEGSSLKINNSFIFNSNILNINGKIIIGTSNIESSQYSLYINENNVKINSNLTIGSNLIINNNLNINNDLIVRSNVIINSNLNINKNLIVNGEIIGIGSNISNLKISQLYLDNSNLKLNGNFININSNTGLKVNNSNQIFINLDYSKFLMTSNNEISLTNTAVSSSWKSAIPFITNPDEITRIYFNKNESYVGIYNDDPRSYLHIGRNGNLLRLATINDINDSYYSQIATNDNVDNNNNTKIKLIPPIQQSLLLSSNSYDISGSIDYYTTGSNPIHRFNYESNGIINSLMSINKNGTVFINNNNRSVLNNERLVIYGNVSILNSNLIIPPKVIIGENNNAILQMNGNIIIGNSNADSANYSLYVNSNVKFNKDLVIDGNILGASPVSFTNTVSIGTTYSAPIIEETEIDYVLNVNGNVALNGIINTSSDKRLKTNINTYENSLDKILKCRGVSFNFNNENKKNIGVIAQELEEIFPELVSVNKEGYKNVNYIGIIGILIEAIKDLNKKIENKSLSI